MEEKIKELCDEYIGHSYEEDESWEITCRGYAFHEVALLVYQNTIDNACKWLNENLYNPKYLQGTYKEMKEQFINDFRKAMDE